MDRISKCLLAAALAVPFLASGSAWAQWSVRDVPLGYPDYPYDAAYNPGHFGIYGYPYYHGNASYIYGWGYLTAPLAAAPVVTGRSVAVAPPSGDHCVTQVRTCELYHASFTGNRCSCRVTGGRARGSVTH